MALKSKDKVRFESIKASIIGMLSANVGIELVKAGMKSQIEEFEKETGQIVRILSKDNEHSVDLIDKSKDFLRIRNTNPENKVLRTKVSGVGIEIKIFKAEEFSHSNEIISEALRELAEQVSNREEELSELEPCELSGSAPEEFDGLEDHDELEEGDSKEEVEKELQEIDSTEDK